MFDSSLFLKPKFSEKKDLTSTILISTENFSFVEENSVDFFKKYIKMLIVQKLREKLWQSVHLHNKKQVLPQL